MSRTDAHVPVPVRIARGELGAHAKHDHRTTSCDLPPRGHVERRWRRSGDTDCYWDRELVVPVWSCQLCHGGDDNRRDRRRDRHAARAALRRIARDPRTSDD